MLAGGCEVSVKPHYKLILDNTLLPSEEKDLAIFRRRIALLSETARLMLWTAPGAMDWNPIRPGKNSLTFPQHWSGAITRRPHLCF
jgi:hypothetical protein